MNQFRLQYIYTWKCHNETHFVAILNKQKCPFLKSREQKGRTGPVSGLGTNAREKVIRKKYRRVNVVEILCTHKNGKMRPVETVQGMGEGRQRRILEGRIQI
jgi:hypothetical protein